MYNSVCGVLCKHFFFNYAKRKVPFQPVGFNGVEAISYAQTPSAMIRDRCFFNLILASLESHFMLRGPRDGCIYKRWLHSDVFFMLIYISRVPDNLQGGILDTYLKSWCPSNLRNWTRSKRFRIIIHFMQIFSKDYHKVNNHFKTLVSRPISYNLPTMTSTTYPKHHPFAKFCSRVKNTAENIQPGSHE